MTQPTGPALATLTRRLIETPPEFLDDATQVHAAAVVNDVLKLHGARAEIAFLQQCHASGAGDGNRVALLLIGAWLLADPWFICAGMPRDDLQAALLTVCTELSAAQAANAFVADPDRREELARTMLARLDFLPQGETPAQASDRLSAISGVERRRLVQASRAAEKRARDIRAALARKAAQESADKWSRE